MNVCFELQPKPSASTAFRFFVVQARSKEYPDELSILDLAGQVRIELLLNILYNKTMDRFLPLLYIVGWFGAIFTASYLINWLLVRSVVRRWYRYFVGPGVIVHELSHAAGCLMTNSQITEINFWKPTGGHVKHLQSSDPLKRIIADPIIALAPIGGTFIVLIIITYLIMPELFHLLQQTDYGYALRSIPLGRWQTWLYLYLTTSLLATIAPSKTDMNYALASLVVLSLALILLLLIPGVSGALLALGNKMLPFALFTLLLLILGIVVSFFLAVPYRNHRFTPKEQID